MKINFVYDFYSYQGKLLNGINPLYLKFFFKNKFNIHDTNLINEFKLTYNHDINFWPPSYMYGYGHTDEISIFDIDKLNDDELYLYQISTSGDFYEFLSLRETKHNTSFYYISEKAKKLSLNKNFFIFIEHAGEPYFDSDILKVIYDRCLDNNINPSNVIILNGSNSNKITVDDFIEKYQYKDIPKLISYNWVFPFKSLELRSNFGLEKNAQAKESTICKINHISLLKEKKALILTKRLRIHRLVLLSKLFKNELIEKTLYSLDMEMNFFPNFIDILNDEPETIDMNIPSEDNDELICGYNMMVKKNKSTLDYDDFFNVHGFGMETKELYEKTFFSIVSETEFSYYQQSLTEKSIKPIMHCHPFVIVGSPNSLKTLKEYGFKTFDRWWDESYDSEYDNYKRMGLVYGIIETLLNKSDDEWYLMLTDMRDILEYNQNLLLKFDSKYIHNVISDKLNNFTTKSLFRLL